MDIRSFALGPLQTNCYVLSRDGRAVVVDPGGEPSALLAYLEKNGLGVDMIVNTHLHFDHIYGNRALSEAVGAEIYANPEDRFLMDMWVGRGGEMGLPPVDEFEFLPLEPGEAEILGRSCRVLATPGHTPGSLSLYFPEAGAVFVGDLLFNRSIGRTDFPGGDMETLLASVRENIFSLPPETVVYSGHGPETTVGAEQEHNPFFSSYAL